eukprot:494927-Prorocentrum_minimum.AAC.1
MWDAESHACIATLEGHTGRVRSVAVTSDGRRYLSGSNDKTVRMWDAESHACIATLKGHTDWVRSVAVTPDGRRYLSGSRDNI